MTTSDVIATCALVVGLISAILSIASFFLSKKSLSISLQQHNERYNGIKLYLIDGYKWTQNDNVFISFALRLTNDATIANAVACIDLQLEYFNENKIKGTMKISPHSTVSPINLKEYTEILSCPLRLSEKSAKSGWITFKLPHLFNNKLAVDLYKILATTTDNKTTSVDTHIINVV